MVSSAAGGAFGYGSGGLNTTTMPFIECGTYKTDCYQYNTSNSTFTNSKLGDGIGEVRGFGGTQTVFYTSGVFIKRSRYNTNNANTGLFSYEFSTGAGAATQSFRIIITKK